MQVSPGPVRNHFSTEKSKVTARSCDYTAEINVYQLFNKPNFIQLVQPKYICRNPDEMKVKYGKLILHNNIVITGFLFHHQKYKYVRVFVVYGQIDESYSCCTF